MKKLFLLLIISPYLIAAPSNVEVIFLSRATSSFIPFSIWSPLYADNSEHFECVETEDGCFHPQLGIIKKSEQKKAEAKPIVEEAVINTRDTEDSFEHDCSKDFKFDIFCGKGAQKKKVSDQEIWIDISASMKGVDYSSDPQFCERRYWVADLLRTCSKKIDFFIFNTVKRPLVLAEDVCLNEGTNDKVQMVEWLKNSKAKNILIITDVDEYTNEFREYLTQINAKVQGVDKESLFAKGLNQYQSTIISQCR